MIRSKGFIKRVLIYIVGLFILALGVSFAINSNLGVSPVSSMPYIVSIITDVDMGIWVIVIYSIFILVQILLLRKDFNWINLTQILFATIFGYFVDFTNFILGDFIIPGYLGKLLMLAISMILIAMGISMYVSANLVNMPMEGMVAAINKTILKKLSFADVKVIMDIVVVIISIILSFVFLGKLVGIREGTVLCALFVGKLMKPIQSMLGKYLAVDN